MEMHIESGTQPPLLEAVDNPENLRALPEAALEFLAWELRDFLIESVSRSGGHFGGGLGAVELSIALHYVFDTPRDRLVWDVGHQTYPHKILTGRRRQLAGIRKRGGLSGFPRRSESPYDTFGVAHAGTAVGAALGMAIAAHRESSNRQVVAVVGDGAMTAGMTFEALGHAGDLGLDILVILNDNGMSISPGVGALSSYLTRIQSGPFCKIAGAEYKPEAALVRLVTGLAHDTGLSDEPMGPPGALFENLGFRYFGPIDGHDLQALTRALRDLKTLTGPRVLHVVTRKGKGYAPAEAAPVKYHAVAPFDPAVGVKAANKTGPASYTEVFGNWLCDMAALDPRLIGITPAMREGSGLVDFARRFPDRYFDTAIAEQHAVTLAAGLACEGQKPVVAIYSTFLQRAYDQLIHDVAIQNLPVLFAIDRAGLVGPDGPTHAGSFDLSYLRCVPNMIVMAPADENECRQMLYTGFMHNGPAAVRYPRARGSGVAVEQAMNALPIGKAELRRRGKGIAILVFGAMLETAIEAAQTLDATVVNMRFVKPLDGDLLLELTATHRLLVTLEDNAVAGGAGSAVNEYLVASNVQTSVINLGLPDQFVDHGERDELLALCGLDVNGIIAAVEARCELTPRSLLRRFAMDTYRAGFGKLFTGGIRKLWQTSQP